MFGPRYPYNRKPPAGVRPNLAHPSLKDCILFYPFTETGSRTIHNVMRPGYLDGTDHGSTDFAWGITERGASVRVGDNNQQQIGANVSGDIFASSDPKTFTCYFKFIGKTGAEGRLLSNDQADGGFQISIGVGQPDTSWTVYDGSWNDGPNDAVAGEIYHLVVTNNGSTGWAVYIDGELETSWTGNARALSSFQISDYKAGGGQFVTADVYQTRLYRRELNAYEAKQLYIDPWAPYQRTLPIWINTAGAAPTTYTGHSIVGLPV